MKEVAVNIRMTEDVKALWKAMAQRENRSMSSYIELLLTNERDRIKNEQFTVKDVLDLLNQVLQKINTPKKAKVKDDLSPIHDVELPEGFDPELWEAWVIHKRKMGIPMKHYQAQKEAQLLAKYEEDEGWDIELLIKELIHSCARSIYIPTQWRYATTRKQK